MAKAKTAANAVIELATPKKPKTPPLVAAKEAHTQQTRMGDVGFDPRYDERLLEQQRLNDLTTTVDRQASQEIPSIYLPDYEGYGYVSSMADRSAGGGSLISVNGLPLNRPVNLQGGQSYMFENPGQVWASGDSPARAILLQAAAAKALTGKDPLYLPWRMAPTGSDFATMTGETMLSFADTNMGADAKKALNAKIKEFIPNWKGVEDPASVEQFRKTPDATRKAIHKMMDKDFRDEGSLGIGEARLAIADPEQLNSPVGYLMNVGKIHADKPLLQQSGHASYPRGVPGEGLGRINDERSLFELYPKTFPIEEKEKIIRPKLLDPATALSEYNKLPNVVESRKMEDPKTPTSDDTRALQMKPYYGILTEDILRGMGYAEGGAVHKADGGMVDSVPEEAIKNTVRDPQAARLLDLDLAKYALMNQQPQRMMGGGGMKKVVRPIAKSAISLPKNEELLKIWKPMGEPPPTGPMIPTQQGRLSQAEYDANLAKYLEGSTVDHPVYHSTGAKLQPNEPLGFSEFNTKGGEFRTEMGSHFGTPAQANSFGNYDRQRIIPAYISANNPLRLIDEGRFGNAAVTEQLKKMGLIDNKDIDRISEMYRDKGMDAIQAALHSHLKGHGFDSIKYLNRHEGLPVGGNYDSLNHLTDAEFLKLYPESRDSHIVFSPNQVKSAIGNRGTFDTNNPDMTKAHGGAVHMAQGGQVMSEAIGGQVQTPIQGDMSKMTFDQYRASIGMHEGGRHMAQGGQVHMEDGGFLKGLYKNVVPAHLRTFGETLMGDRTPITEKNFTTSELDQMRHAIMSSRKDREAMNQRVFANEINKEFKSGASDKELMAIMQKGPSQKIDQTVGYQHYPGGDTGLRRDMDLGDDAAIRSTLGRFAYNKDANGNLIATDNYKFTNDLPKITRPTSDYDGMGTPEKLWTLAKDTAQRGGLNTLPSRLGNAFIGADGRPVNVNLGAAPYANGGQVQRFDEGGQASLDQMRYELSNSPVMQATPRSPIQDFIGTAGGYMDRAGKFVSEAIEPTAEKNPVKHFLADMLLAAPLKGAGTLMQDLTGTVRETDEDNPVRGVIDKNWKNLTNGTQPLLDPRVLDIAQFATPVVKGATKLVGAGAKAIAPFATKVDDMVRELHASGAMPQPGLSIKDVTPKALAPANEQGFYSPTEAAALNLQRKSGNGQAFMNDLLKQENVRPDEIKAMGLDTFLKDKKNVTAAEVQDYIAQNKLELGESVYDNKPKPNFMEFLHQKGIPQEDVYRILEKAENGIFDKQVAPLRDEWLNSENKSTKFQGYQLPGGENYREVVLTLPAETKARASTPQEALTLWKEDARAGKRGLWTEDEIKAISQDDIADILNEEYLNPRPKTDQYQSSHFDEPNILAHLRMSDRVTDGKKTLLVDEVQSDWHQAGREQGYQTEKSTIAKKAYQDYASDLENRYVDAIRAKLAPNYIDPIALNDQVKQVTMGTGIGQMAKYLGEKDKFTDLYKNFTLETNQNQKGVPDAPYKEDWYQLALRRAVKEAIDGGYDRVALPTGARVGDRFNLSHQIDRIDYNKNSDGTYNMSAIQDGGEAFAKEGLDEKELSRLVGKDIAKKIVGDEGKAPTQPVNRWVSEDHGEPQYKSLSGLDLNVGGEGMKKYYDEIYPGYLKKFGKKYGATVGKTDVVTDNKVNGILEANGKFFVISSDGINFKEFNNYAEAAKHLGVGVEPLHYMDITPAMRKEFSTGIHMAKGGKVSFAPNVESMRYELNKRQ